MHDSREQIKGQPHWHKIGVLVESHSDGVFAIERNYPEVWGRASGEWVAAEDLKASLQSALESTINDIREAIEELERHKLRLSNELDSL